MNKPFLKWKIVKYIVCTMIISIMALIYGCDKQNPSATISQATKTQSEESKMWVSIGEHRFSITLANNETAQAFQELLPLMLEMKELNNNEKYAELASALPTNAKRPGNISNGDSMLYGTNTLVLFYVSFPSSYSYTRIGHIDNPNNLSNVLGRKTVQITFSKI